MASTSHVLVAVVQNAFFLPHTVNVIHVRSWLTETRATVAAENITLPLPSLTWFIIAEQTSQRSATEIEP